MIEGVALFDCSFLFCQVNRWIIAISGCNDWRIGLPG